ncbi:hypothetical protein NMY22_g10122 [Coprinellus aureogranulatus]|nr:hypothetical protein NMY22_g10122 [Coprinellus aureogranulatus]
MGVALYRVSINVQWSLWFLVHTPLDGRHGGSSTALLPIPTFPRTALLSDPQTEASSSISNTPRRLDVRRCLPALLPGSSPSPSLSSLLSRASLLLPAVTFLHFKFRTSSFSRHPGLPTLATTTLTLQSSHQPDEDFINKSLLDSLNAQADAEPPHSAVDAEGQGPSSFKAPSDTSSTSSSIAYPISLHSQHQHLLRSESPSDRNQHILNQLQDSSYGLYSHSSNMNIQPDFNEFETTKLQQHGSKFNTFGANSNFRASFTSLPNNNRPHPSSFRETHNFMQPDVYPPQLTSPMGSYDSHGSLDFGHPSQQGLGGPKVFMGDYNANAASLMSHHNNPKANGPMVQQQSHAKYSNSHAFSGGDIIFSAEVSASLSSAAQQKRIGESKVIAARAEVDSARLMRQAADILASPAAMQIRQLEALQQMAKSGNSKVIFVPMQLQSDVVGQLASNMQGESSVHPGPSNSDISGLSTTGRAAVLNSMADV